MFGWLLRVGRVSGVSVLCLCVVIVSVVCVGVIVGVCFVGNGCSC